MGRGSKSGLIVAFQALRDDLHRLLTWRTGDADDAADLVQETYFRLAAAQETGHNVDNPRAYVLRTATNLAIDWMRQKARLRAIHAPEDELEPVPDPAVLPEEVLLARERLRLLDEALRQLPPKPRQALLLNRVEGLTQAEIAKRLGVSESMVIKYVAQALRHCRAWRQRFDEQE
jgi:RNA polymerase sigma factor (sigma-70 family)